MLVTALSESFNGVNNQADFATWFTVLGFSAPLLSWERPSTTSTDMQLVAKYPTVRAEAAACLYEAYLSPSPSYFTIIMFREHCLWKPTASRRYGMD